MYTFALVNTDIRLPNVKGWYLVVDSADTFTKMHGAVTKAAYLRFNMDPHLSGDAAHEPDSLMSRIFNPVKLGQQWFDTAAKYFFSDGLVYVNQNGGMVAKSHKIKVLETLRKKNMEFPLSAMEDKSSSKVDEWITISSWANGKHYYISSRYRVFSPEKFDTLDEARKEALKYVDEKHVILSHEKKEYAPKREGD